MTANTMSSTGSAATTAASLLAGVWQRDFEQAPLLAHDGDSGCSIIDRDTLVLWTQASPHSGGCYVDLRLPLHSPGRSLAHAQALDIQPRPSALAATGYSERNVQRLLQQQNNNSKDTTIVDTLLTQQSFAGVLDCQAGDTTRTKEALKQDTQLQELVAQQQKTTSATGGNSIPLRTCYWHRHIDCQPLPVRQDIGVCCGSHSSPFVDGSSYMRETGDDASYAEGWWRLAGTEQGPFMAMKLQTEELFRNASASTSTATTSPTTTMTRTGYWVRAANRFAYAVGYPESKTAAQALGVPLQAVEISTSSHLKGQSLKQVLLGGVEEEKSNTSSGSNCQTERGEQALQIQGSYLALAGEITDQGRTWEIQFSTNPELVGCCLVQSSTDDDDDDNQSPFVCSSLSHLPLHTTDTTTNEDHNSDDNGNDNDNGKKSPMLVQQRIPIQGEALLLRTWKVMELSPECDLPLQNKCKSKKEQKVFGMDVHPDFVDVELPRSFHLPTFYMSRLSPECLEEDFEAVMSSASVLKGLFGNEWPEGLTKEDNQIDLAWHEREFTLGRSFSWIVRGNHNQDAGDRKAGNQDTSSSYLGCAYLFPEQGRRGTAKVVTWIRRLPNRTKVLEHLKHEFKIWLEEKLSSTDVVLEW